MGPFGDEPRQLARLGVEARMRAVFAHPRRPEEHDGVAHFLALERAHRGEVLGQHADGACLVTVEEFRVPVCERWIGTLLRRLRRWLHSRLVQVGSGWRRVPNAKLAESPPPNPNRPNLRPTLSSAG